MIAFSIMMWFVSIILVFLSISLLRGNYASVHGKVFHSTDNKEGYAKALGKPVLLDEFEVVEIVNSNFSSVSMEKNINTSTSRISQKLMYV